METDKLGIKISKDVKYKKWLKACYKYAEKSTHPSTHNAAMLIKKEKIILKGANVFPPGVKNLKYRSKGENKRIYRNHAERDVIYKAARKGIKTNGMIMVMPWLPCISCADAIISSGVKKLVSHKQMIERTDKVWQNELKEAVRIMKEAGVMLVMYDGSIGVNAYMHYKKWKA